MRRGGLSLVVVVMAALSHGPVDAGPVSVHVAAGTATEGYCGEWSAGVCPELRQLQVAAVEGGAGRAIYRAGVSKPVAIDLDCVAFASDYGHNGTYLGRDLRRITDRARIPAHSLGATGIGDDGKRYWLLLWDNDIYDGFYISTAKGPYGCGAPGYDGQNSFGFPSDFSITHAGNAPPVPRMEFECEERVCNFDATDSIDADGTIVLYRWEFLEGHDSVYGLGEATGPTATFTWPENTYPKHVVLRVTDDSGDTSSSRAMVMDDSRDSGI